MSFFESVRVAVLVVFIVFLVLLGLYLSIKGFSFLLRKARAPGGRHDG